MVADDNEMDAICKRFHYPWSLVRSLRFSDPLSPHFFEPAGPPPTFNPASSQVQTEGRGVSPFPCMPGQVANKVFQECQRKRFEAAVKEPSCDERL